MLCTEGSNTGNTIKKKKKFTKFVATDKFPIPTSSDENFIQTVAFERTLLLLVSLSSSSLLLLLLQLLLLLLKVVLPNLIKCILDIGKQRALRKCFLFYTMKFHLACLHLDPWSCMPSISSWRGLACVKFWFSFSN